MSFAVTSIPLRKNSKLLHRAGALAAASDDGHVKWSDLKKVIKKDGQQVDEQSAMSTPLKRSTSAHTDDDELELYREYKAKLSDFLLNFPDACEMYCQQEKAQMKRPDTGWRMGFHGMCIANCQQEKH